MLSKTIIISAVLVAVYAQQHTYSLKTVIKHEQPKQYHHSAPAQHSGSQSSNEYSQYSGSQNSGSQSSGSQYSGSQYSGSQNSGSQNSGSSQGGSYGQAQGGSHGHAVSSQSIVRHETGHGQESHKAAPVKYFTPTYHVQAAPEHHTAQIQHGAPIKQEAVHHGSQSSQESSGHHDHDYYAYPKYEFEYKVSDPHTGDNKYQQESRDGDVVKGVYSLHEADGSIRTVEYNSDKHSGFNAYVKHSESNKHPQVDKHYHH